MTRALVGLALFTGALASACGASEKEVKNSALSGAPNSDVTPPSDANSGGENMAGSARPVVPSASGSRYVFQLGELRLEVDAARGGRIVHFGAGGDNLLTGPDVVAAGDQNLQNMFGSTFWTSPQSDWGWPPEVAVDQGEYRATVDGNVLSLESGTGEKTGYAVTKRIWADAALGRVSLEYTLHNLSATKAAAPWEVSRVPKSGFVFFPSESDPLEKSTLLSQRRDGVAWLDIAQAPAGDSKLFQDGSEGWLAYVRGDIVFIKTFENVPLSEQAEGESEIEVYVNGGFDYVEIEQQGRYQALPSGGSAPWRVDWYLRQRPAEIEGSVGDPALVSWVRSVLAAAR